MYNTDLPTRAELPSTKQLLRSTVIALISAIILLVGVVLPAEYAIDPTGLGRVMGLTDMGEIKAQLVQEAIEDEANTAANSTTATQASSPQASIAPVAAVATVTVSEAASTALAIPAEPVAEAVEAWRDTVLITLKPGQGAEVKLVMQQGETAHFNWITQGGPVNFDTHGDAKGNSISYEKGRGVATDEGELVAAFTGNHGWFFRNRNDKDVNVVLKTKGSYEEIKGVL